MDRSGDDAVPVFGRRFFDAETPISQIGDGELGGKASSLLRAQRSILTGVEPDAFGGMEVSVPAMVVLGTDIFRRFVEQNNLSEVAWSDAPDDRIALAFQQADLPPQFLGDLRALVNQVRTPLAVRSSSLLEDALAHPFAGVYGTKMIPNNQPDADTRFRRLVEAIKFVYASTFFAGAKAYLGSIGRGPGDEAMAVIIQEVVGRRSDDLYYPDISGVARSHSYYPTAGARAEDGVVDLALGLGKTIVDGGLCWIYSPVRPAAPPPFNGVSGMLKSTQRMFWAVNMGRPPMHDPIRESEYLLEADLVRAEADGRLDSIASTYDAAADRVRPGLVGRGPRILDFRSILEYETLPLNAALIRLMQRSEESLGAAVEIEFAVTLSPRGGPARIGFLQVRPMRVSREDVELAPEALSGARVRVASTMALGNGSRSDIRDVVFVKPDTFEARHTGRCALEIAQCNRALAEAARPYMLVGPGRWGSSDPWLGIPVEWSQISAARVIVEAALPSMCPDPSQGSHFFHNMISFEVAYLTVSRREPDRIDWEWFAAQEVVSETEFVMHVRLAEPMQVQVDGHNGRAVVEHE